MRTLQKDAEESEVQKAEGFVLFLKKELCCMNVELIQYNPFFYSLSFANWNLHLRHFTLDRILNIYYYRNVIDYIMGK